MYITCVSWQFSSVKCFLLLRVSDFLWIKALVSATGRSFFLSERDAINFGGSETFGDLSCHRRQTDKSSFGCFEMLSGAQAPPMLTQIWPKEAALRWPRLLSEISHVWVDGTTHWMVDAECNWIKWDCFKHMKNLRPDVKWAEMWGQVVLYSVGLCEEQLHEVEQQHETSTESHGAFMVKDKIKLFRPKYKNKNIIWYNMI